MISVLWWAARHPVMFGRYTRESWRLFAEWLAEVWDGGGDEEQLEAKLQLLRRRYGFPADVS